MPILDEIHTDGIRDTALWHPFASMAAVRRDEFVIVRGEDVWVWDSGNRRYLDATASLWYMNVGHGRAEIVDAVNAQMRELAAYSIFNDLANPPALALAARLSAIAPMRDSKVFLSSGGGDAVEAAIKLARLHSVAIGGSRTHVISRAGSYHGTHGIGTSIAGIPANRIGYEPLTPHMSVVDADSTEALECEIDRVGPECVCAFIFEPVLGAGGVYPPAPGYVERVAEICRSAGILLIVDATICGFGRLGTWFGIERWGVEPDMVIFSKGITSGYLPLGGLLVAGAIAAPSGRRTERSSVTARRTLGIPRVASRRWRTWTSWRGTASSSVDANWRMICSRRLRRSPTMPWSTMSAGELACWPLSSSTLTSWPATRTHPVRWPSSPGSAGSLCSP